MHHCALHFRSQGAKNYVRESHLARFLDLVIWGHEHECLADPWVRCSERAVEGALCVMQRVTRDGTREPVCCL